MADEIELLRLVSELVPEPTTDAWARAKAAVAAAREQDLIRQGAERSASDLRTPARITREVARRRRRRLALRSAAGVAAALTAGAVALAAAVAPGARHNGIEGLAVNTAYVVRRVDSALNAAGPAAIAQMTVTTRSAAIPGGTTTAEEWAYGDQWRSVTNSPAGHPVYDEGSSTASVYTLVSYRTRTWAREPALAGRLAPASGPRNCRPVVAAIPSLFQSGTPGIDFAASSQLATVARSLHAAISCGTLAVAGRQRVDGIDAIELTSRPGSLITETIWVSPGTYLPVRVVVRSAADTPLLWQTADITWLRRAPQNLARLTVSIPQGFRQVPFAEAVGPILARIPGHPASASGPGSKSPP
jgi:hypothetical protein